MTNTHIFTVTDYSALHTSRYYTYPEALDTAARYTTTGGLPATITDQHGCRWTVYPGRQVELSACSAALNGWKCECDQIGNETSEDGQS